MPEITNRPFPQFNFLVDLKTDDVNSPKAGFQEVSGIGMEVSVAEYRPGNHKTNNVMKVNALNKSSDVTLKRGIIGALDLYDWLDKIRNGSRDSLRNISIQLRGEDRETVVMEWQLKEARIIKYTCGPLNAKGTDVAMEEMVLAYERLEMVQQ